MLNEVIANWLLEIPERDLALFFKDFRSSRLNTLNQGQPNYEMGKLIQDEVAALHRLEKHFIDLRAQANKQEK